MSLRFFVVFCVCAIFVASNVHASQINFVEEPIEEINDENDLSLEQRNPLLQAAIKILKAAFKWVASHCLKEAAEHCKQHWPNPKALIKCAGEFFKANQGRCALG